MLNRRLLRKPNTKITRCYTHSFSRKIGRRWRFTFSTKVHRFPVLVFISSQWITRNRHRTSLEKTLQFFLWKKEITVGDLSIGDVDAQIIFCQPHSGMGREATFFLGGMGDFDTNPQQAIHFAVLHI